MKKLEITLASSKMSFPRVLFDWISEFVNFEAHREKTDIFFAEIHDWRIKLNAQEYEYTKKIR